MNEYFNLQDSVFDVTEKYPVVIPYLIKKGFTALSNPLMRNLMGKKISMEKALLSKRLNPEECEKEMIALIEQQCLCEDSSADPTLRKTGQKNRKIPDGKEKNIRIEGVLPCPIRIPLFESFEEFYADFMHSRKKELTGANYSISYDLRSANLGIDWIIEQVKTGKKEKLPDVLVSAGFDLFFDKKLMGAFIESKEFNCSIERMNKDFCNDYIDLRDDKNNYAVIGVVPAVMVVNTAVLGGKAVPRTWADLLSGRFDRSVSLPVKDLDLFNSVLLNIYRRFGTEGVQTLAKACSGFLHPAQMVKENRSEKENRPAVSIAPYFFSKMIKDNSELQTVWPEDGAIVAPIFMLVKRETAHITKPFVDFFLSSKTGNIFAQNGYFPSTNPDVDNKLEKDKTFSWVGWDFIYENDIGGLLEKLRYDFESALE